jgi:hypothetical protein
MQQQVRQLRFATTRLATGPRVRYAEQGDPGGAPIIFPPTPTRGSPTAGCCRCCLCATTPTPTFPLPEMFFHARGLADLGPAARPRNAAGAQLLPIQHVQVDVQPPAGSSCRDVLGGLAAAISGILVVHLRGHR